MKSTNLIICLAFGLLSACGIATAEPTPSALPVTATQPPTATRTATPIPPDTPSPTATATPFPFAGLGQIMFYSYTANRAEVYVMNADGSEQTQWINVPSGLREISWSPDGALAALVIGKGDANGDIYVMNADGSDLTQLTDNAANDWDPAWSPDGTKIAFTSQRDPIPSEGPPPEIYVMDADGGNQIRLTNDSISDSCPAWSPDGTRIAFSSFSLVSYKSARINVINADGSGETLLVDTPLDDGCPVWSPDGSQIVFESRSIQGERTQIIVMNADGSNLVILAEVPSSSLHPGWSPDGNWIIFSSDWEMDRDGNADLYVMRAQGSEIANLSQSPFLDERNPVWMPFKAPIGLEPTEEVTAAAATPELTDSPLVTAAITKTPCTDLADFVIDVTIPDGTKFSPGEAFTKTWRIRNSGSCAWTANYNLVYGSGDQMNAADFTPVTSGSVPPGSTVDVSVDLLAPDSEGSYKGVFQLQSDSGEIFTTSGFWVVIDVVIAQ